MRSWTMNESGAIGCRMRVLGVLTTSLERPVGIEAVREVAARVALSVADTEGFPENDHGDHELAH